MRLCTPPNYSCFTTVASTIRMTGLRFNSTRGWDRRSRDHQRQMGGHHPGLTSHPCALQVAQGQPHGNRAECDEHAGAGDPCRIQLLRRSERRRQEEKRVYVHRDADVQRNAVPATAYLLPLPDSGTFCVLIAALSTTVRSAERAPVAVGVNVTEMMQSVPAASELGQALLRVKSPVSAPVTLTLVISSVVVPVLVRVTFFVLLWPTCTVPKFRLPGLKLARGLITVADRLTCCGLPAALSLMLSVAESEPTLRAKKTTLKMQLFPTSRVLGQKFTKAKSSLLAPLPSVNDTLVKVTREVPMFFTVTFFSCRSSKCTVPKLMLLGVTLSSGG